MGRRRNKPNVVYVFSDEHRYQSLQHTEEPWIVATPNLERLAREGAAFTLAISPNPVCVPARAMQMVSQWPYRTGLLENTIPAPEYMDVHDRPKTFGEVFQAQGYRTSYIGKTHIPQAYLRGFDEPIVWINTNDHQKSSYRDGGERIEYSGYNATGMTDQALEFIRCNQNQPFFLMLSLNPPHAVFTDAPASFQALYQDGVPFRPNVPNGVKDKWAQNYRGYLAHISAIDVEFGRILDTLNELGLEEDTVVVYTSDHGSMMGSHAQGNKRFPHEESIRIPFMVRWPQVIAPGLKIDRLYTLLDALPTIVSLAGLPVPPSAQGFDYSPLLKGEAVGPDPDSVFLMHIGNKKYAPGTKGSAPIFRGVRSKRYTYAVNAGGEWLLFDNVDDPHQLRNRIDDPGYESVRSALAKSLQAWLRAAEDPYLGWSTSMMSEEDATLPIAERIGKAGQGFQLPDVFKQLDLSAEQLSQADRLFFAAEKQGAGGQGMQDIVKQLGEILTAAQMRILANDTTGCLPINQGEAEE